MYANKDGKIYKVNNSGLPFFIRWDANFVSKKHIKGAWEIIKIIRNGKTEYENEELHLTTDCNQIKMEVIK